MDTKGIVDEVGWVSIARSNFTGHSYPGSIRGMEEYRPQPGNAPDYKSLQDFCSLHAPLFYGAFISGSQKKA